MLSKWFENTFQDMLREETLLKKQLEKLFYVNPKDLDSINEYLKTATEVRMDAMQKLQKHLVSLQLDMGRMNDYIFIEQKRENNE
jgi:hypothetical protein